MKKLAKMLVLIVGIYSTINAQTTSFTQKIDALTTLLTRGVEYLKTHTIGDTCHQFAHNPSWRNGDLFFILIDDAGNTYFFNDERQRIWGSVKNLKDVVGTPLLQLLFKKPTR